MAAGALSAHGAMRAGLIVFLGVAACLLADGLWFWFGRRWGSQAMRLLCRFATDPRGCAGNARTKFRRYGLHLLFVYKFVPGLDGLLPPLCGAEGVSAARFIALDTTTARTRFSDEQFAFLDAQLQSAGDKLVFVYFHLAI